MEAEPTPDFFPLFPEEIKENPRFVCWTYQDDTKVPINIHTGGNAGVNYPNTWAPYEQVVEYGAKRGLGIAYVLTPLDDFTVVDLDKVKQNPIALEVISMLSPSYVERSPSLTGFHIWLRNQSPVNRRMPGLEIYSSNRYMTITGRANPNGPKTLSDRTEELQEVIRRFFPQEAPKAVYERSEPPVEDREVWTRLFNSRNGATFQALFNGDVSVTRNDHSRGVLFLANMLAMMTDGDAARMERLLRQTGLGEGKWDSKRGNRRWIDLMIDDAINYARGKKNR